MLKACFKAFRLEVQYHLAAFFKVFPVIGHKRCAWELALRHELRLVHSKRYIIRMAGAAPCSHMAAFLRNALQVYFSYRKARGEWFRLSQ